MLPDHGFASIMNKPLAWWKTSCAVERFKCLFRIRIFILHFHLSINGLRLTYDLNEMVYATISIDHAVFFSKRHIIWMKWANTILLSLNCNFISSSRQVIYRWWSNYVGKTAYFTYLSWSNGWIAVLEFILVQFVCIVFSFRCVWQVSDEV